MPDQWMLGAARLDIGDHAPCDPAYPPKAVAHITWDRDATAAKPADLVPYENLRSYFSQGGQGVAPHILWDPFTGRFTQFTPADSRSKSVVDAPGGTRTNRAGRVVIQIEALFFPNCRVDGHVYARLSDTPCTGWADLHAWVKSFGVPDTWPMGRPTDFTSQRDEHVWETEGGWYGHQQVPENTHQDPGSWPAFPAAPAPKPPAPKPAMHYAPFPGAAWFRMGRRDPVVTAMHKRLVAAGCNRYQSSRNADVIGTGDVASYEAWQRKYNQMHHKGWAGAALQWPPGKETWDALHVPKP